MRRLLILPLCIFAVHVSAATLVKQQNKIEEYILDNGLHVVLAPNENAHKVMINTVYFTGALNDPKGKGGLAHLLEHLAFKGTQDVTESEFQRRLDQYTLMHNAMTNYDATQYMNVMRPDQHAIDEIIYLEAQRMNKLVIQDKFVPSEIEIVRREREVSLDQPFSVLMNDAFKSAYGNQDLGRLPIGDLAELRSIRLNELKDFYQRWYAPNNATVVVTGKFDKVKTLNTIEQNFKTISAKTLPAQSTVGSFKANKKQFSVQKGSYFITLNMYIQNYNVALQPALALTPYLYDLEPTGLVYKNLVQTGKAIGAQSSVWVNPHINSLFVGAVYEKGKNGQQINKDLTQTIEQSNHFNETDIKRAKTLFKNETKNTLNNEVALNAVLSDYLINTRGHWENYFTDQQAINALTPDQLNQMLNEFINKQNRLTGEILPTPNSQKKAQKAHVKTQTIIDTQPTKLKSVEAYQTEITDTFNQSIEKSKQLQTQVQRGTQHGVKYAFYKTTTPDQKTYAKITLHFANVDALKNKAETLKLMTYLLFRGSMTQTLEQIQDKAIEMGADVNTSLEGNTLTLSMRANQEDFDQFFVYAMDVIKHPNFDEKEFNLAKQQTLASLQQAFTEPSTVSALTLDRQLEQYQPDDIRYHFEPELVKATIGKVQRADVIQAYKEFFNFDQTEVAVTGQFDAKKLLEQFNLPHGYIPYAPVQEQYRQQQAKYTHAFAEKREFGSYQGSFSLPLDGLATDASALKAFNFILGGSQLSSRLGQALREKNQLVYGFNSAVEFEPDSEVGSLNIQANYTPGKAQQVSQVIHSVLKDMITNGITEQELAAYKSSFLRKSLTRIEDPRGVHSQLNWQLKMNRDFNDENQRIEQFKNLTVDEVNRVIRQYIHLNEYVEVSADQFGK